MSYKARYLGKDVNHVIVKILKDTLWYKGLNDEVGILLLNTSIEGEDDNIFQMDDIVGHSRYI